MKYAKLINNTLIYATNPINIDGRDVITTDPTPYGYKPVVIPEAPSKDGFYAVFDGWQETSSEIRQKWRLEPTPSPEPTDMDRLEAQVLYTAMMTDTILEE